MKSSNLWLAVVAAAALAAAATSFHQAWAAKSPAVYTVVLQKMKFGPVSTTIHVGDTVEWVNNDIFVHSATAADKSFDVELKPMTHVRTTFHKPGTFPFTCRYHPGMAGTLVVTE